MNLLGFLVPPVPSLSHPYIQSKYKEYRINWVIVVDTQWQYQHVNKFQISIFYGLAWKWFSNFHIHIRPCYGAWIRWNCFALVFYIHLLAGGQFKWMTHYNSLHLKIRINVLNPFIDATKRSHFQHSGDFCVASIFIHNLNLLSTVRCPVALTFCN